MYEGFIPTKHITLWQHFCKVDAMAPLCINGIDAYTQSLVTHIKKLADNETVKTSKKTR